MTLPIVRSFPRPTDLKDVENGKVPTSLRVAVAGGGELHHLAARAWNALCAVALATQGLGLTYTHGGTYRTLGAQTTLFKQRYAIGGEGGGCKNWNGEVWCKKSAGLATAAVPGTSNHGWGLAIDMAYDDDFSDGIHPNDAEYIKAHPAWGWLLAEARNFGFAWELNTEPWHIRYICGDALPQAVLDYEISTSPTNDPGPVPTPDPEPTPADPTGDLMQFMPELVRGTSHRDAVTCLQALLRVRGARGLQVDGQYGRATEDAVRFVQGRLGLEPDGRCGPKTWHALAATPV